MKKYLIAGARRPDCGVCHAVGLLVGHWDARTK